VNRLAVALALGLLASPAFSATIEVEGARLRPPVLSGGPGAIFLTLVNHGPADRLIGATVPQAVSVELHTHLHENGVVQMRRIGAIALPENGRAELKPGGDHLMVIGLPHLPAPGSNVPLSLTFERAGVVTTEATVLSPTAPADATSTGSNGHDGAHHGSH
jgi:copper(I)-binding protein